MKRPGPCVDQPLPSEAEVYTGTPIPLVALCALMARALISLLVDVYNFGNLEQNPDNGLGIPVSFSNVY